MASACRVRDVAEPEPRTRYIVFGRLDQMGGLRAYVGRPNVFSMEAFGPDAEQPLSGAQQALVLQAVSFAEASGADGAAPPRVVCCCPGGVNRSVFLAGVLRLRRTRHPELAALAQQPVNALYRAILAAMAGGADLDVALSVAPVRASRKRRGAPRA